MACLEVLGTSCVGLGTPLGPKHVLYRYVDPLG